MDRPTRDDESLDDAITHQHFAMWQLADGVFKRLHTVSERTRSATAEELTSRRKNALEGEEKEERMKRSLEQRKEKKEESEKRQLFNESEDDIFSG